MRGVWEAGRRVSLDQPSTHPFAPRAKVHFLHFLVQKSARGERGVMRFVQPPSPRPSPVSAGKRTLLKNSAQKGCEGLVREGGGVTQDPHNLFARARGRSTSLPPVRFTNARADRPPPTILLTPPRPTPPPLGLAEGDDRPTSLPSVRRHAFLRARLVGQKIIKNLFKSF